VKLLLVDGNSLLFRAYYATSYGNIMQSNGTYTNAVYGFASMFFKAVDIIKPSHCVVAFDKGKHTFRHDMADDYKAGRPSTPEELVPQFKLVRDMLDKASLPYLEYDEIEADDIVGTLSKAYPGVETIILTGDKDMLQLIDSSTTVYRMLKGISEMEKLDEEGLKEKYGLSPKQIIDLKGLMGDSSDNIKGVKGVGQKTAEKLLQTYGTCENIYEHIDELKGKLKENLINDKDSCFLSKQLATIKTDVDINEDLRDFEYKPDLNSLNDFYREYGMRSLIREDTNIEVKEGLKNYEGSFVYFDIDKNEELLGICLAKDYTYQYFSLKEIKENNDLLNFLKIRNNKIIYDYKTNKHLCKGYGIELEAGEDLMLSSFLVNNYNSDLEVSGQYYGKKLSDPHKLYSSKEEVSREDIIKAIGEYSSLAYEIYKLTYQELEEKDLIYLYEEVEKPLSDLLFVMEENGVLIDQDRLEEIAIKTKEEMDKYSKKVYETAGHEFNLNSPKQLATVLYDEMGLPSDKKRGTSAEVLEDLAFYNPVVADILQYRKYAKLYSTYASGLSKYIASDGRIHTRFSQTITQTGRLSSYDPNLQNISVRDQEGKEIREAFIAKEGYLFLDCDYSQIELRVLASLAQEERMIKAFKNNIDIHLQTAIDIFEVNADEVTPELRRKAKAVNFGIVYGISDFGLAKQANISRKEAHNFIDNYYRSYPKIGEYLKQQVEFAQKNDYVLTMLKRRRYIKEINEKNYMSREFGKRAAMNAPIQGSAADLMKLAMLKCGEAIKEKKLKSKLLLQVHDELLFEVPEEELELMKKLVSECMNNVCDLKTGLEISIGSGKNWAECK